MQPTKATSFSQRKPSNFQSLQARKTFTAEWIQLARLNGWTNVALGCPRFSSYPLNSRISAVESGILLWRRLSICIIACNDFDFLAICRDVERNAEEIDVFKIENLSLLLKVLLYLTFGFILSSMMILDILRLSWILWEIKKYGCKNFKLHTLPSSTSLRKWTGYIVTGNRTLSGQPKQISSQEKSLE